MEIWLKITINIICSQFAVLMLAKIQNKKEKQLLDYRLFTAMLITISFLLVVHSIALITNGSESIIGHIILRISVSVLIPGAAFLAMIYAIHIEKITNKILRGRNHLLIPYFFPLIIIIGLNTASEYTGWFFIFDDNGYFQTGRFLYIPIILSFSYIIFALALVVKRRKSMNAREYVNIFSVPIPMIVAASLQSFYQEIPILLPGCVLSLFLVFSNIQERRLSFDHLTGAYNRQTLDEFLDMMIEDSKGSGKPFAALLADVNKFKYINDNYGHTEGDTALVKVVKTIRAEIRHNDFLARYAGDEFVVVFPNCEEDELDSIVNRIKKSFSELFIPENKYSLSISIGASVFSADNDHDSEVYIKRLDSMMYQDKKKYHSEMK